MKFNPCCSGSSQLEIYIKKKKVMKSTPGIPLPRGDNLFAKGPNDPKTLPKRQKRSKGAKFDGNYTKYGYYQLTVV